MQLNVFLAPAAGLLFTIVGSLYTPWAGAVPRAIQPPLLLITPNLMPSLGASLYMTRLHRPSPLSAAEENAIARAVTEADSIAPGRPEYHLEWAAFATTHRPSQTQFPRVGGRWVQSVKYPVILFALYEGKRARAFAAVTLFDRTDGGRDASFDYIINRSGVAFPTAVTKLVTKRIAPALGIRTIFIESEWAGRRFWAHPEIAPAWSSAQPRMQIDGEDVSAPHLMRWTFANFLERRGLQLAETDAAALDALNHPRDLFHLRLRSGRRVPTMTLVESDRVKRKPLHLGASFLALNHAPGPRQVHQVQVNEKFYSDEAMPPWFGEFICESQLLP